MTSHSSTYCVESLPSEVTHAEVLSILKSVPTINGIEFCRCYCRMSYHFCGCSAALPPHSVQYSVSPVKVYECYNIAIYFSVFFKYLYSIFSVSLIYIICVKTCPFSSPIFMLFYSKKTVAKYVRLGFQGGTAFHLRYSSKVHHYKDYEFVMFHLYFCTCVGVLPILKV